MIDIAPLRLALIYLLMLLPLAILLWYGVGMVAQVLLALLRMTCQLLLVGIYLELIFDLDLLWLNLLWIMVMIGVADVSVVRGCGFRLSRFCLPLFLAMLLGVAIPLLFFIGCVLQVPNVMEARFAIPIAGMILGNCLRANIVGIGRFYGDIRDGERRYLMTLAQGATWTEAVRPFVRDAIAAALAPTTAMMATMGLVSLPGMMTGVMMGGAEPLPAIKYQIAIMVSIFASTAMTVFLAIRMTARQSFNGYGVLDLGIFVDKKK